MIGFDSEGSGLSIKESGLSSGISFFFDNPIHPGTEKLADGFSYLLLCVLGLGPCQWNRLVADATAVFCWSLMNQVRNSNSV